MAHGADTNENMIRKEAIQIDANEMDGDGLLSQRLSLRSRQSENNGGYS